jgi:hypothetical protein
MSLPKGKPALGHRAPATKSEKDEKKMAVLILGEWHSPSDSSPRVFADVACIEASKCKDNGNNNV